MNISKDTVVTLHYQLSDAQGNLIEESSEPMVYLHGGYHNTLPKIEEALDGKAAGYQVTIQVEPEDAFGEYDAELVKIEPRNLFPDELEVGMQFEASPEGDPNAGRHGAAVCAGCRRSAQGQRRGSRARSRAWSARPSPSRR